MSNDSKHPQTKLRPVPGTHSTTAKTAIFDVTDWVRTVVKEANLSCRARWFGSVLRFQMAVGRCLCIFNEESYNGKETECNFTLRGVGWREKLDVATD